MGDERSSLHALQSTSDLPFRTVEQEHEQGELELVEQTGDSMTINGTRTTIEGSASLGEPSEARTSEEREREDQLEQLEDQQRAGEGPSELRTLRRANSRPLLSATTFQPFSLVQPIDGGMTAATTSADQASDFGVIAGTSPIEEGLSLSDELFSPSQHHQQHHTREGSREGSGGVARRAHLALKRSLLSLRPTTSSSSLTPSPASPSKSTAAGLRSPQTAASFSTFGHAQDQQPTTASGVPNETLPSPPLSAPPTSHVTHLGSSATFAVPLPRRASSSQSSLARLAARGSDSASQEDAGVLARVLRWQRTTRAARGLARSQSHRAAPNAMPYHGKRGLSGDLPADLLDELAAAASRTSLDVPLHEARSHETLRGSEPVITGESDVTSTAVHVPLFDYFAPAPGVATARDEPTRASSSTSSLTGSSASAGGVLHDDDPRFVRWSAHPGGLLVAATLERLLVHVTSTIDAPLVALVCALHAKFLPAPPSVVLLRALTARFDWASTPDDDATDLAAYKRVVRVRTFVVLRHWLLEHFARDFAARDAAALRDQLAAWLNSHKDLKLVRSLRSLVRRLKRQHAAVPATSASGSDDELQLNDIEYSQRPLAPAPISYAQSSRETAEAEAVISARPRADIAKTLSTAIFGRLRQRVLTRNSRAVDATVAPSPQRQQPARTAGVESDADDEDDDEEEGDVTLQDSRTLAHSASNATIRSAKVPAEPDTPEPAETPVYQSERPAALEPLAAQVPQSLAEYDDMPRVELDDLTDDEDEDVVVAKRTLRRLPGAHDLRLATTMRGLAPPATASSGSSRRFSADSFASSTYDSAPTSYAASADDLYGFGTEGYKPMDAESVEAPKITTLEDEEADMEAGAACVGVEGFILDGIDSDEEDDGPSGVEAALLSLEGKIDEARARERAAKVAAQMAKSERFRSNAGDSTPSSKSSAVTESALPHLPPLPPSPEQTEEMPRSISNRTLGSTRFFSIHATRPIAQRHHSFVLDWRTDVLAQQFLLIERDILRAITPKELMDGGWREMGTAKTCDWEQYVKDRRREDVERRSSGEPALERNVAQSIARYDLVANWVASELVLTTDLAERTNLLAKFIRLAFKCYRQNNFQTLAQVVHALQSDEIASLDSTWARLPRAELRKFDGMREFVSHTRNFKLLRESAEALLADSTECLPFFGIFLRDLAVTAELPTFIDPSTGEACSSTSAYGDPSAFAHLAPLSAPQRPMIGLHKLRLTAHTLERVAKFQTLSQAYTFEPTNAVYLQVLKLRSLDAPAIRERAATLALPSTLD